MTFARRPSFLASLLFLSLGGAAVPAAAQGAPQTELFGGYSLARQEGETRNGWSGSLAYHFGPRLALVGDASGHYGKVLGVDIDRTSLTGGLRLTLARSGGLTIFAHALAGVVRESAKIKVFDVTISETDTRFGGYAGGGLDLRVSDSLALRLAQVDYAYVAKGDGEAESTSGLRASLGLVLRFGRR